MKLRFLITIVMLVRPVSNGPADACIALDAAMLGHRNRLDYLKVNMRHAEKIYKLIKSLIAGSSHCAIGGRTAALAFPGVESSVQHHGRRIRGDVRVHRTKSPVLVAPGHHLVPTLVGDDGLLAGHHGRAELS